MTQGTWFPFRPATAPDRHRAGQAVLFAGAMVLGWLWFGSQGLLLVSFALVVALAIGGGPIAADGRGKGSPRDPDTGLPLQAEAEQVLDASVRQGRTTGHGTAAFALEVDDFAKLTARMSPEQRAKLLSEIGQRLEAQVRDSDLVARLTGPRFAVVLAPTRRTDMDMLIKSALRLQDVARDVVLGAAGQVRFTLSVGFCSAVHAGTRPGADVLRGAVTALDAATPAGPGGIRAYSEKLGVEAARRHDLATDAVAALEAGDIVAWFQPQVEARTGALVGLEAVARWQHPEFGPILPRAFLPALEAAQKAARLNAEMLTSALSAMRDWRRAGLNVPRVAVNFGPSELSDPGLPVQVRERLETFGLRPEHLVIEVLESVLTQPPDDIIFGNLKALSAMGCQIDLDDFGGANCGIQMLRRLPLDRIKIDRALVVRVDLEPSQEDLVAGVLALAGSLGLTVLAEGAETIGEYRKLAEMGCRHIQGYSIAEPMPREQTGNWIRENAAKRARYGLNRLHIDASPPVCAASGGKTA